MLFCDSKLTNGVISTLTDTIKKSEYQEQRQIAMKQDRVQHEREGKSALVPSCFVTLN